MTKLLQYFLEANVDLFAQAPLAVPGDDDDLLGPEADARNLAADWRRVGDSLRQAMAAEMAAKNANADVQEF